MTEQPGQQARGDSDGPGQPDRSPASRLQLLRQALGPGVQYAFSLGETAGSGLGTAMPAILSTLTFLNGVLLLLAAALPGMPAQLDFLNSLAPLALIEASHFASSVIGMLLVMLSIGLRRRMELACAAGIVLTFVAGMLALTKGVGTVHAAFLFAISLCLYLFRGQFYRRGNALIRQLSPITFTAGFLALGAAIWLGLFSYRHVEYSDDLWWTFLRDADASRFLRAMTGASIVYLGLVTWRLMTGFHARHVPAGEDSLERAAAILPSAECGGPDANLALSGDKRFLFSASGQGFIMYGQRGRSLISMAGPVGRRDECRELIRAFTELADRQALWPVFYAVRRDILPELVEEGFVLQKIGETAIVPLQDFSMEGSARARLRQAFRRLERDAISFRVAAPEEVAVLLPQLRRVSDAWLEKHHGTEKSFTLGRFEPAFLTRFPVAVLEQGGTVIAFANLFPAPAQGSFAVDMMRYDPTAPGGLMDTLFVSLILWGKENGYSGFDLGMAPLAGLEDYRLAPALTRLGAFLYRHGDPFYGFDGLRQYKSKFAPDWEPVYMAGPSIRKVGIALGDVSLLTSGGIAGMLKR